MPRGFNEPAHRVRSISRAGAGTAIAGLLVMSTTVSAQAVTDPEETATPAVSELPYPAPGQPTNTPPNVDPSTSTVEKDEGDIRVATLHADLTGESGSTTAEGLASDLEAGNHLQARTLAQTVQFNDPDVLVLTGVSYDDGEIARLLQDLYLGSGQGGQSGIDYPYLFTAPTNSGVDSGADLDGDGAVGGPGDAIGYGDFAGQHGMIVFSKHPIVEDEVRTFQNLLWRDVPDSEMPEDEYSDLEQSILRLFETSMWDVPILPEGASEHLHVVATSLIDADGAAVDAARAEDQRRVLTDYVTGQAPYLTDGDGDTGGLGLGDQFVIAGLPTHADSPTAQSDLDSLVQTPGIQDTEPVAVTDQSLEERPGSIEGTNGAATRVRPEERDVRASVVLPSEGIQSGASGIFWPGEGEYGYEVIDPSAEYTLDDRLVWADLSID